MVPRTGAANERIQRAWGVGKTSQERQVPKLPEKVHGEAGVAIAARQNRDSLDSPDFDRTDRTDRTDRQPFPEGARALNKLEQGTDTDWLVLGG